MNTEIAQLQPGTPSVCHGSGLAGDIIRTATQSWAGHATMYLGNGVLVQGQPPKAALAPADSYGDALWFYQMWDQLKAEYGWSDAQVTDSQGKVVARGQAEVGTPYDFAAYAAFTAEVLKVRSSQELAGYFAHDPMRVCSALVADALMAGGVPLDFVPEDGPGVAGGQKMIESNLVAPGMLLGLAQRKGWL